MKKLPGQQLDLSIAMLEKAIIWHISGKVEADWTRHSINSFKENDFTFFKIASTSAKIQSFSFEDIKVIEMKVKKEF